jgi:hypothetical protein
MRSCVAVWWLLDRLCWDSRILSVDYRMGCSIPCWNSWVWLDVVQVWFWLQAWFGMLLAEVYGTSLLELQEMLLLLFYMVYAIFFSCWLPASRAAAMHPLVYGFCCFYCFMAWFVGYMLFSFVVQGSLFPLGYLLSLYILVCSDTLVF